MRTRSQSRNNFPQQEASPVIVEPLRIELSFLEDQFQEDPPPEVPMADNRTMTELLQAPTEGYEDAIVIPKIATNNFELKHEAWDRFNDLLRACPHHVFFELHQLDTFYKALNVNDQDSLNSAAGGNFFDKMPRECLKIIKSKPKVRQSRAKAVVAKVSTSSSTPAISSEVAELKDLVRALLLDKKNQSSALVPSFTPAPVKAVEPNFVTCGGTHSYQNCPATSENVYRDNIQEYVSQAAAANYNQGNTGFRPQMVANQIRPPGFLPHQNNQKNFNRGNNFNQNRGGSVTLLSNTITSPKEELKGITTRSGVTYQGPTIPTPSKQGTKVTKDQVQTLSSEISASMPNLKSSLPYPSRRDNERCRDQANEQIDKFYEIFKDMSFKISFTDALILMPKFASTLKALIGNKEKLSEMARTPNNEHCSAVIPNKLPRKLRDPDKFLIPCEFPGMDECLALADLGASINLMALSVWEALLLSELTPTCMTLELMDRSVSKPISIAKDVSFKVGVFHFPAVFMVVDFEPDPRVPLILERCFLKTGQTMIDVHKGELTLRIRNEAITYNLDQTMRYSANYNQMTANKIDVIEMACEEYSQEVLSFSDVTASGNPTPHYDPIILTMYPTLTPFGDSDFLLFEEADAFLGLEDDSNSPKINPFYYNPEGDILLLEAILNKHLHIDACLSACAMHQARSKVCEDTNLSLNWEKSHFMVKEGIVLGHKIFKNGIVVDRAKVDVIAKLPHPTTVKGVRSFPGHAGFYQRFIQDFSKISRPMTHLLEKNTPFIFSEDCIKAFQTLKKKLTEASILIAPNWDMPFKLMKPRRDCSGGFYYSKNLISKVMLKDGVTHRLTIAYHPQTSGQVDVSNHGLKRILERTIGENRASWSDKLDDALWAFRTTYKTPIGCTLYKLVYEKACHLPIELEHKAYWALKQANFDLAVAGDHQKVQLNGLKELRDHAYENSLIYKEKTKRIHHSKIKNRVFNVGDRVILFNSRLKIFLGKLKTYCSGPFTITKVFPYGTVELSQANGPNFKVNGHHVKHYFGGDVPQLVVLDLQTSPRTNEYGELDYPNCEAFHALSFSFTRASHPQLHFGNPVSKSYRLRFN
nr:reverse transcriptase domain-containing protein [Tanacetum cinerariifolium]